MNLLAIPRKWAAAAACLLAATYVTAQSQPPAAGTAAVRNIDVNVVARKPQGGVRTVRVQRGETIVLRLRSDEALSVHVHGYDLHANVVPGTAASVPFVARWTGRFPIAAHPREAGSGRHVPEPTLLYLEVLPE